MCEEVNQVNPMHKWLEAIFEWFRRVQRAKRRWNVNQNIRGHRSKELALSEGTDVARSSVARSSILKKRAGKLDKRGMIVYEPEKDQENLIDLEKLSETEALVLVQSMMNTSTKMIIFGRAEELATFRHEIAGKADEAKLNDNDNSSSGGEIREYRRGKEFWRVKEEEGVGSDFRSSSNEVRHSS